MTTRIILFLLLTPYLALAAKTATLHAEIEQIRAKYKLPALAAIAMRDGRVLALTTVGVRRFGWEQRATANDR